MTREAFPPDNPRILRKMPKRALVALLLTMAAPIFACGGSSQPSAASSTASPGASPAGKLRLGHYSSGDGMVGFVLDRTGPVPKVRLDGTSEVVNLEIRRTSHTSMDLVSHEKHLGIAVDDDGSVVFSQRGAGPNREMYRDADASAL
jgi:hypothetical protein